MIITIIIVIKSDTPSTCDVEASLFKDMMR